VICPDLRGAGWTDAPATGYVRDQLRADVVALMDALKLDRVSLIAHDGRPSSGSSSAWASPNASGAKYLWPFPSPYIRFDPRFLVALRYAWYQLAIAPPIVGPRYLSKGDQRLPHYLFRRFTSDQSAWSEADIELFLAKLREPARARAGSALYRNFIVRELPRILRGAYRSTPLTTPTQVPIGADDPVLRPELLGGHETYADDLTMEFIGGASHFIADERPDLVVDRALEFFARPARDADVE
jgi:pimeloyl-ACP methyl ester carboxylesterase